MSKTAPINEYRVLINTNNVIIIAGDDVAIAMHELVNVRGDKLQVSPNIQFVVSDNIGIYPITNYQLIHWLTFATWTTQ